MASETTELASAVTPENRFVSVLMRYILVFWQRIVLGQRSLQLLGDQMYVTTMLDSTLTVARSFLLLTAT